MPAASTTRRSCSSPHWPRTLGERSAWTRRPVSTCSVCCALLSDRSCSASAECVPTRFRSTSSSLPSTFVSDSLSGWTSSSMAFWRPSRSVRALCWNSESEVRARSRNDWLFWRSASEESAAKASRSLISASWISSSFSADARRSACSSVSSRAFVPASSATSFERTMAISRSACARITSHTPPASSRANAAIERNSTVTVRSLGESLRDWNYDANERASADEVPRRKRHWTKSASSS